MEKHSAKKSLITDEREDFSQKNPNPSACVPVVRVSDEGGFGRARPLGRAQPVSRVSGKTDRSRGWNKIANSDKTIAGKGRFQISTPPHVGKGVGIP
jgi:hypothetical protein